MNITANTPLFDLIYMAEQFYSQMQRIKNAPEAAIFSDILKRVYPEIQADYNKVCEILKVQGYAPNNLDEYKIRIEPTTKEAARQMAIEWQYEFNEHSYSYAELIDFQCRFEYIAYKFDLIEEFTENCII